MATQDINTESMTTDELVDTLHQQIESEPALLTTQQMDDLEALWLDMKTTRRCALVMLTQTWKELDDHIMNNKDFAEAAASVVECLNMEPYDGIRDLLHEARRRILVSLCGREDMEEIMERASKASQ